jgi:hypothetical protein
MVVVKLRGLDRNIRVEIGLVVLGFAAKSAILIVEFAKQAREMARIGRAPVGSAKFSLGPGPQVALGVVDVSADSPKTRSITPDGSRLREGAFRALNAEFVEQETAGGLGPIVPFGRRSSRRHFRPPKPSIEGQEGLAAPVGIK